MKKLFFAFLFIFLGFNLYSQNEYIIDKKGKKIIIDDGSTMMSSVSYERGTNLDITIYYKKNGKEYDINFLDTKEAKYGDYEINTYNLAFEKNFPYFTLIDYNGFKLISFTKSSLNHFVYILDSNNNLVEDLSFKKNTDKELENRKRVDSVLRQYFGDCEDFIRRLDRYKYNNAVIEYKSKFRQKMMNPNENKKNEGYENLDFFFYNPVLQKCQN